MRARPRQTNCQVEPPYPEHATAVFSIRDPMSTVHLPTTACRIEEPHKITECAMYMQTLGVPCKVNAHGDYIVPVID